MTETAVLSEPRAVQHWLAAFPVEARATYPEFYHEHMKNHVLGQLLRAKDDPERLRGLWKLIVSSSVEIGKNQVVRQSDIPDPTDEVMFWTAQNFEQVHEWLANPGAITLDAPSTVADWLQELIEVHANAPAIEKQKQPRIIAEALYIDKKNGEVIRVSLPKYAKLVRSLRRCVQAREVDFDEVVVIARGRLEYRCWSYRGQWFQSGRENQRGARVPLKPFAEGELESA